MSRYDVIVVGAGAGGASAAYFLAAAGARVLVVEKSNLPRYKPCGGAMPRATLDHFPFSFDTVVDCEPRGVVYCWQGGQPVRHALKGRPIAMVMREHFDSHILGHAPANIWDGRAVRSVEESEHDVRIVTEGGSTATADYLIAADGAASQVARMVGLWRRRPLATAIEAEVTPDAATWERYAGRALFDFGVLPFGYLWIFAKKEHLSVGIICLKGKCTSIRQTLFQEMSHLGIDLAGARLHGHPVPLYQRPERRGPARTLLVGDAAGLVDSFSGEGIRHAIVSGKMSAQAILEGRPGDYSARIERYARSMLGPVRTVAGIFYRYPRFCFRFGMQSPGTTGLLANWLNGEASKAQVMTGLLQSVITGALRSK